MEITRHLGLARPPASGGCVESPNRGQESIKASRWWTSCSLETGRQLREQRQSLGGEDFLKSQEQFKEFLSPKVNTGCHLIGNKKVIFLQLVEKDKGLFVHIKMWANYFCFRLITRFNWARTRWTLINHILANQFELVWVLHQPSMSVKTIPPKWNQHP